MGDQLGKGNLSGPVMSRNGVSRKNLSVDLAPNGAHIAGMGFGNAQPHIKS